MPLRVTLTEGLCAIAAPLRARDFVEAVSTKLTAFRQGRMIKVFAGIHHSDSFHHGAGGPVDDAGERHDFVEVEPLKGYAKRPLRGLGGKTLAPIAPRQTQPTSTHGMKDKARRGTDKPTEPMNARDSTCSTAQLLQPRFMTSGSAFIAAKGSRS